MTRVVPEPGEGDAMPSAPSGAATASEATATTGASVDPGQDAVRETSPADPAATAAPPAATSPPTTHNIHPAPEDPKMSFDAIDGRHITRSSTATIRAWKLLGKAALLARAMNPREDVIDIYHDPKAGNSRFMIHPNSKFRRIWEITTAACVLYVCIFVPLVVGFNYVDWGNRYVVDTMIDIYFIVDMFVTLRTGIFSNGEVIMDSKVVMRRYFRTWFIVDIISNFPLALFVRSTARKSIKIVKLQKLPKLLRIGRLLKYLREYAKYYHLVLSFVGMIMGLHFFACLWASFFNRCFDANGDPICGNDEMPKMYVQSVHTIMLMFLGIAETTTYAGISKLVDPHNEASPEVYVMSVTVFLLGLIFSSFLFGNILALIISWDQQSAQFRNRMDVISAEMRYYELPEELQHRVRRNYDYLWINQRAYSDMMLLNQPGISKTLRMTIALHLYKDLVKTVPFFAGSDARFLGKVCLALETAVYLPGDTIIYYDDIGKEMFIVRKGLVEIIIPEQGNNDKRIYLRDGNFFGETALVIDVRRTNTVKAVTICDLNVLSKTAFNEIVAEYPEFGERMKRTVIKRQLDNMNIQSPAEKIKIQNQLNMVVEKSLKARRMSVSLRTIYRAKKLGDKLKEIADRATKTTNGRRLSTQLSRLTTARRPSSLKTRVHGHSASQNFDRTLDQSFAGAGVNRSKHPSSMAEMGSSGNMLSVAPSSGLPGTHSSLLPPLVHQGSKRAPQIDAVSRKLSRAEITMDLIPNALMEITNMVNQIKRTTDRLNRRLHQTSDVSSDEDDDVDLDDDFENQITVGVEPEDPRPAITPLPEELEEEVARRESRSVVTLPPKRPGSIPSVEASPTK